MKSKTIDGFILARKCILKQYLRIRFGNYSQPVSFSSSEIKFITIIHNVTRARVQNRSATPKIEIIINIIIFDHCNARGRSYDFRNGVRRGGVERVPV